MYLELEHCVEHREALNKFEFPSPFPPFATEPEVKDVVSSLYPAM